MYLTIFAHAPSVNTAVLVARLTIDLANSLLVFCQSALMEDCAAYSLSLS